MFSPGKFARTVFESQQVQESVDKANQEYVGFEEAWIGLTWLLARRGHLVGEEYKGCRIYKSWGKDGKIPVPTITTIYRVKEDEIDIIDILIRPPS